MICLNCGSDECVRWCEPCGLNYCEYDNAHEDCEPYDCGGCGSCPRRGDCVTHPDADPSEMTEKRCRHLANILFDESCPECGACLRCRLILCNCDARPARFAQPHGQAIRRCAESATCATTRRGMNDGNAPTSTQPQGWRHVSLHPCGPMPALPAIHGATDGAAIQVWRALRPSGLPWRQSCISKEGSREH